MMLMNKKGGEYVEASIVLPLLVLLIVSMIYAMMFFYGHADRQIKLHKVSLDKAKTSSSLFKKEKYKVEDSSLVSGAARVLLRKDIYADIYLINEADLVRAGNFVKGLKE